MHNGVIDQHVAITSNGVDVFMEKLLTKSNGSDESHGWRSYYIFHIIVA